VKTPAEVMFQAIITAGWANRSTGEVEAPTGHVAIVDLSTEREMLAEVLEEPDLIAALEETEPGWYVVTEDGAGFVAVAGPMSETEALGRFLAADAEHTDWLESQV
jgi:hypothetical protein